MKLTLIQSVQNELYDFIHPPVPLTDAQARKLQAEMVEQNLSLMESVDETDLMVTTEAINYPGRAEQLSGDYASYVDEGPMLERLSALAKRKRCWIVAGLFVHRGEGMVNAAVIFDRQGRMAGQYDKVHLVGDEQQLLLPGREYLTVDADFGRFGVAICWDMQFPEVCRHYALEDARLVVCPTWGWEGVYAHARAYENGIWVAGAMAVPCWGPIDGIRNSSEVVAPDGSVRVRACRERGQALTCEIDLEAMRELHDRRMHDRRPETYGRMIKER